MAGTGRNALTLDGSSIQSHEPTMKCIERIALACCSIMSVAGCVGPGGLPFPPPPPPLPPLPGFSSQQPSYPVSEPAELIADYRSGYDIGSQDRGYGYPQDAGRAYQRFGRSYENAFREGYFDGYSGRPMQR